MKFTVFKWGLVALILGSINCQANITDSTCNGDNRVSCGRCVSYTMYVDNTTIPKNWTITTGCNRCSSGSLDNTPYVLSQETVWTVPPIRLDLKCVGANLPFDELWILGGIYILFATVVCSYFFVPWKEIFAKKSPKVQDASEIQPFDPSKSASKGDLGDKSGKLGDNKGSESGVLGHARNPSSIPAMENSSSREKLKDGGEGNNLTLTADKATKDIKAHHPSTSVTNLLHEVANEAEAKKLKEGHEHEGTKLEKRLNDQSREIIPTPQSESVRQQNFLASGKELADNYKITTPKGEPNDDGEGKNAAPVNRAML